MIEVKNLKKAFGSQIVLNNLNLKIQKGAITVIVGKSGGGKSVLLKNIIRLLEPDSGSIVFDGVDLAKMPERKLKLYRAKFGVLFQEAALFDSWSVYENVAFPAIERKLFKSKKELDSAVMETLKLVKLEDIRHKMPSELSGGMKKRVGLARAIITKPDVIFFDEPTTGLDPVTSASIGSLILSMKQELGTTCFVISHDLELTRQIADFVGFLYNGKIEEFVDKESFFGSTNKHVVEFINAYRSIK